MDLANFDEEFTSQGAFLPTDDRIMRDAQARYEIFGPLESIYGGEVKPTKEFSDEKCEMKPIPFPGIKSEVIAPVEEFIDEKCEMKPIPSPGIKSEVIAPVDAPLKKKWWNFAKRDKYPVESPPPLKPKWWKFTKRDKSASTFKPKSVYAKFLELFKGKPSLTAEEVNAAFQLALKAGDFASVSKLLKDSRVDPSYDDHVVLKLACIHRQPKIVKKLLDRRVDPSSETINVAMESALGGEQLDIVEMLFKIHKSI